MKEIIFKRKYKVFFRANKIRLDMEEQPEFMHICFNVKGRFIVHKIYCTYNLLYIQFPLMYRKL